jgi:hypothetical protein
MKHFIATAFVAGLAFTTLASDYPPGYPITRVCESNGPVEVCAINQAHGHPQLFVRYTGHLSGVLNAYVRLNGRDGVFRMRENTLHLNGYQNVHRCQVVRPGDFYADTMPIKPCPPEFGTELPDHAQRTLWYSEPPKPREAELFFYARDQFRANVWDVEVAITDGKSWDSRNSENYFFQFMPQY